MLIPLNVAMSMEFEGEPIDLKRLEDAHASQPLPPGSSTPLSADSATLADHLAERVAAIEVEVERGSFLFEPIHEELMVSLHHAICADLENGSRGT
jgi:hypothetical protein